MKIIEVKNRDNTIVNKLFLIWEESVKSTHKFLSITEINTISKYVPEALKRIPHLVVAFEENKPVAFAGIDEKKLEMLFSSPSLIGKGLGRQLLEFAQENFQINQLCVNEQNPNAKKFYEHMGFRVIKRTDKDEQGNPFPLLYMIKE